MEVEDHVYLALPKTPEEYPGQYMFTLTKILGMLLRVYKTLIFFIEEFEKDGIQHTKLSLPLTVS